MKKILIILIMLSLIFISCSKESKDIENKSPESETEAVADDVIEDEAEVIIEEEDSEEAGVKLIQIKAVRYNPEQPSPAQSLSAVVVLTGTPDEDAEISYTYKWVVNDKAVVQEENSSSLESSNFKTGDWVYCIVTMNLDGNLGQPFRSKMIRIKGLVPVLNLSPVPVVTVPGKFYYIINATDPYAEQTEEEESFSEAGEAADMNKLRFELISPIGRGITIDTYSGEINWDIKSDSINKTGETVEIKFRVINRAGSVTSSVKLVFSPK